MESRYALGIDVGGTKLFAGVIDVTTGEIVSTARKRTRPERGGDFFIERLLTIATQALQDAKSKHGISVSGIGIGIAGQVDRSQGIILGAPNLARGVVNLRIADILAENLKLPAVVGNDVEIATYGEQYYGAGRNCDDFACVFVGTGIGAAIVQGGRVRRGATGTAGEIGHTVVHYGGRLCSCGGRGHLEAYASRSAVTRVLRAEIARGRKTILTELLSHDATAIRSKIIAQSEEAGDGLVCETLAEAGDYLGAGLGSLATLVNPERVVLGGGLIEATHGFFERAVARAHEITLPTAGRSLDIVHTALGDDSGIIGAAWMALNRAESAA